MKRFFLASILAFTVLRATEENIWDSRGAYVKYGLSSPFVIPILPTLGFGYYWDQGVDVSAMINFGLIVAAADVKLLALPVIKEDFQFGVGPSYTITAYDSSNDIFHHSLGISFLFRFPKPEKKTFFQVEVTQPIIPFQWRNRDGVEYLPGVGLMWGYRF